MGNMSYCRFENTLNDLRDCSQHMGDDDLSQSEGLARTALVELCKTIVLESNMGYFRGTCKGWSLFLVPSKKSNRWQACQGDKLLEAESLELLKNQIL